MYEALRCRKIIARSSVFVFARKEKDEKQKRRRKKITLIDLTELALQSINLIFSLKKKTQSA